MPNPNAVNQSVAGASKNLSRSIAAAAKAAKKASDPKDKPRP